MIAIKLLREPLEGLPVARRRRTHCAHIGRAREGIPMQVDIERLSCPLARYNFGMDKPDAARVARYLTATGDLASREAADAYLDSAVRLSEPPAYVAYFAFPHGDLEPDVLVEVARPGELVGLLQEYTRRTGRRLVASVSGLGAACGECTVIPLVSGRANVSLGCGGCRPQMDMDEDDLLLAAPAGTLLFDLMRELAAG
jgi:uncharacterized protein (DUF169 family)